MNTSPNFEKILVQLDDGAVWEAKYNESAQFGIELIRMVTPPRTPNGEEEPSPNASPASEGKKHEEPETAETESGEEEYSDPKMGEESQSSRDLDIFSGLETPDSLEEMIGSYKDIGYGSSGDSDRPSNVPSDIPTIPDDIKERMKDNAFRARLSSVMMDNKYDRKLKGRTRGKLDMSRLYKVPTESRAVFTQKQARQGKQYNVILLVDESGSMHSRSKSEHAAEAVVFLAKNFEGININVGIVGFNGNISIHKEFTEKGNYEYIHEAIRTMNWERGAGSNNDYDGLRRAYKMFERAPEGKNILIMLSDGQPASRGYPKFFDSKGKSETPFKDVNALEPYEKDTRQTLHKLVKAHPDVHSIGIGILGGGWQIPEHFVIKDPSELKGKLINVLRKQIKRA